MEIICIDGCPPESVNVQKEEKFVRWTYQPSPGNPKGKITGVRGLPKEFFSQGEEIDGSWIVFYRGAPEGKEWPYELDSEPKCGAAYKALPPQLTSGP